MSTTRRLALLSILLSTPLAAQGRTPEEVYRRSNEAASEGDFRVVWSCLAADERDLSLLIHLIGLDEDVAEMDDPALPAHRDVEDHDGLRASWERLRERHRFRMTREVFEEAARGGARGDEREFLRAVADLALADVPDREALFAELAALAWRHRQRFRELTRPDAELVGLRIDEASGRACAERPDGESLHFVRVDGAWYLALGG